jgi:hypothetical protein
MSRTLGRKPIGYDMRTGRKVRYADLVEDGENPSIRVHRRERDAQHPQRFPRAVGADRIALHRPAPEAVIDSVTVRIGYEADADALYAGRMWTPAITVSTGAVLVTFGSSQVIV